MATATKQLEAIYQEISKRFSDDDRISVMPLDGEPPEKYEITYRIIGVHKDRSGNILEKDSHTITISIPFGFPHFPPSCKPKTDLFHPDFDPAAICIGEFWAKDRSISDLIFYIGTMISGRAFSTDNAFNEEAAQWYKENSSRLPFDETDFSEKIGAKESSGGLTLESDSSTPDTPPESSNNTTTESAEPEIAAAENLAAPDPDKFKLLVKQHRYFELDGALADLSAELSFPEREKFSSMAHAALHQARELYDEGSNFEHQGNPGRALDAFNKVASAVADYPGIQEDIERTTQAKELLGDWGLTPEKPEEKEVEPDTEQEEPPSAQKNKPDKRRPGKIKLFEDTARHTSRIIPSVAAIIVLMSLCTGGVYYYLSSMRLDKARSAFKECQVILKQNRFQDAERQCEHAVDLAKQIQFFKAGSREELLDEINAQLNDESLQQGLAGNLLLDGQYLPRNVVRTILAFKHFMVEGDKYFQNGDWQKAASNYGEALKVAQSRDGVSEQLVFTVTENLKISQFNILLRSGDEFIKRGKWVLATQDLEEALKQIKDISIENKAETIDSITAKLSEIALATAKQQGIIAFDEGEYDKAVAFYKQALNNANQAYPSDSPVIKEIKELVVKAELYQTIKSGRDSFNGADWDKAISNYEQAIRILESNRDLLTQSNTDENRKKLARIILQTSVIRDKQSAAKALKEHRYLTAIEKLQSIIETIDRSEFGKEIEFSTVSGETRDAIKQAETEMLLADKIAYLENNFKELFTKHYTASPAESLTEPKVVFEKRLGDKLLFRLECVEVGRGRPLRLIMRYIHDLKTGKWNFYSGSD